MSCYLGGDGRDLGPSPAEEDLISGVELDPGEVPYIDGDPQVLGYELDEAAPCDRARTRGRTPIPKSRVFFSSLSIS